MKSIFSRHREPPRFRVTWRGYDRAQVDEFLRRTAADRQRLQEDLAQLDAVMTTTDDERRELERLAAVRREVASCLETSIGALRTATGLLRTAMPPSFGAGPARPAVSPHAPEPSRAFLLSSLDVFRRAVPRWDLLRDRRIAAGLVSVAALMFAGFLYQNQPRAIEGPAPRVPAAPPAIPIASAALDAPAATIDATPSREDGLVITLTARRSCWVNTTLDGGQRMERLLQANETIILRATSEAVLRVGDATALAVLINNQPTRALGTTGEVVTVRITPANYRKLLES
jgi:DivIVA domain-containing protein